MTRRWRPAGALPLAEAGWAAGPHDSTRITWARFARASGPLSPPGKLCRLANPGSRRAV